MPNYVRTWVRESLERDVDFLFDDPGGWDTPKEVADRLVELYEAATWFGFDWYLLVVGQTSQQWRQDVIDHLPPRHDQARRLANPQPPETELQGT